MNRRSFLTNSTLASTGGLACREPAKAQTSTERRFQLGCITYNLLKDMDLDTTIQTLEATEITAVELRTGHRHGVEPSLGAAERRRVRERFVRSKVRLLSYGTTCEFQSPDPAERARQIATGKSFVDLAKDTGALGVKVRPNGLPNGVDYGSTVRNIAGGLRDLGEYGQAYGVEIWMEVHGRGTMEPKTAAEILDTTAHKNVGACWNSNPTDIKNGSLNQSFGLLRPYLRSAHINDLYNGYPWRELFRLLRESGYDRYTLCEVAESQDPDRFLKYYKALRLQLAA